MADPAANGGGAARPDPGPDSASAVTTAEASGRERTFDEFFVAHYRTLLAQAVYAGADMQEADDAAAETMHDVYRNWDRLDEPRAWARRAVVRFFLKTKSRRLDKIQAQMERYRAGTPKGRVDTNLTSWEEWQWIRQLLLHRLTDDQREVMALVLDGYTLPEIAVLTRSSQNAVRQLLYRARQVLKPVWDDNGADSEVGGES